MSTVRSEVMISTPLSNYQEILKIAVNDGKAAAAEVCSTRLDKLANHAAAEGLSAVEIVELLREEAAAISPSGGAAWN